MLHSTPSKQNDNSITQTNADHKITNTSHDDTLNKKITLTAQKTSRAYRINEPRKILLNNNLELFLDDYHYLTLYAVLCFFIDSDMKSTLITQSEMSSDFNNHTAERLSFLTQLNPIFTALFTHCSQANNCSEIRIINTDQMKPTSIISFNDRLASKHRTALHELNNETFIVLSEASVSNAELKEAATENNQLKPVILPNKPFEENSAKDHVVLDIYVHDQEGYQRQATYIIDSPAEREEQYRFLILSATQWVIATSTGKMIAMEMSAKGVLNIQRFDGAPLPMIELYSCINPGVFFSSHFSGTERILTEWDAKNFQSKQTYLFSIEASGKLQFDENLCRFHNGFVAHEVAIPSLTTYLYNLFHEKADLIRHLPNRHLVSLVLDYFMESLKESLLSDLRQFSLFKTPDFTNEALPLPESRWWVNPPSS